MERHAVLGDHERHIGTSLPVVGTLLPRSDVRNLLPGDFTVFSHAVHHPRWGDHDYQSALEPHPPRLFRADPARIRRGIDGGDKLLAIVRVSAGITAVFALLAAGN